MIDSIFVEIKPVYGKDKYYPACDISRGFCELLDQKTLTEQNKEIIKKMGFAVVVSNSLPASL